MYGSFCMFRHYIAIFREGSSAFWEMLNWEAVDRILRMLWRVVSSDVVRSAHHVTRNNTPIHNILLTASQFSISQKALETLKMAM